MKRLILIVLCLMLVPLPVFASGWTQNQTKANQVANIARSMGLPEDADYVPDGFHAYDDGDDSSIPF